MRSSKMTSICDSCGREIEPGEFMAVLAKAPTKGYVGRTETIINEWVKIDDGKIYCKECFEGRYKSN